MRLTAFIAAGSISLAFAAGAAAENGRPPAAVPPPSHSTLPEPPGSSPLTRPADPARAVVLIFNHGTNRPQYRHVCNEAQDVPGVVRDIAAAHRWILYYLCSTVTDGDRPASYTYKRADEILAAVARYRAFGVPARRIFLLGQSAGAWSSLMAARKEPAAFNAIVAFAPAFAGTRAEATRFPRWRGEYRPLQVAYLRQAKHIEALIFAYSDDPFNRPSDLAPLESIPGIDLIAFDACAHGHGTAYSQCFRTGARVEIEDYIERHLAAAP
jgi:pimeloyl-ACP methyl ester carboxylesterase